MSTGLMDFARFVDRRIYYATAIGWLTFGLIWIFLATRGWPPDNAWVSAVAGALGIVSSALAFFTARKTPRSRR